MWLWRTPASAASSAGPSAPTRRSSTDSPTSCCLSSRHAPRPHHALWAFGPAPAFLQVAVSHARIVSTQAALESSEWCMQVQGGQGFRWDNVAHLYLKRAKATQLLFGDPAVERERIAESLGLT